MKLKIIFILMVCLVGIPFSEARLRFRDNARLLMNASDVNSELEALDLVTANIALSIDEMWVFVTGIGILCMQLGFAMLEAGTVQVKNVRSVMMKNIMDAIFGALAWYFVGYGLYNGNNQFAAGDSSFFAITDHTLFGNFVQQFGFAITSVTIVSGAVCSRIYFGRYVFFSLLQITVIYPIAAHTAWAEGGWLYDQGFVDFAGSGVVHGLGGVAALVGAYMLGPRVGRYQMDEDGKRGEIRPMPEHSAVLVVLGTFILFMGWFPFNAGSSGGLSDPADLESASHAMISTLIAASASGTVTTLFKIWFSVTQDIPTTTNGLLAGLVAITGPCATVEPWAAIVIGIGAGITYLFVAWFVLHVCGIDDPLNAFAVHGACGMFGIIITGIFDINGGLIYGNNSDLLVVQLLGAGCLTAWPLVTTAIVFFLLKRYAGLRISDHDQLVGLDMLYHRENAYPEFDSIAIRSHAATTQTARVLQQRRGSFRSEDLSVHSEEDSERMYTEGSEHFNRTIRTHGPLTKLPFQSSKRRLDRSSSEKSMVSRDKSNETFEYENVSNKNLRDSSKRRLSTRSAESEDV